MKEIFLEEKYLKTSSFLVLFALVPAFFALFGFLTEQPLLQSFNVGLPSMNIQTIIGVFLLSYSILSLNLESLNKKGDKKRNQNIKVSLFILCSIFGLTLVFYIYYYITGNILSEVLLSYISSSRTTLSLLFLGIAVMISNFYSQWIKWSFLLIIFTFYLTLIVITGYVIQSSNLYSEIKGFGLSIPTAISLIFLEFAIVTGPARNIVADFYFSKETGGKILRRLLPIALLLPPFYTWINFLLMRSDLYSFAYSVVLQVVGPCFLLSAVIFWMTLKLAVSEKEVKSKKEELESLEELNRAKDEFMSTLSHELRTPMNSIIGFLELLPEEDPTTEEYKKMITIIQRNARSELKLIESILEVSRIATGKIKLQKNTFDLNATLENLYYSFQPDFQNKNLSSSLALNSEIRNINADEERIRQIVWNLIENAIKFTPEGGQINVSLTKIDSLAHIIIEDSGIGLDENQKNQIFESFWQADRSYSRRYSGLGIGLTIAHQLVLSHGGQILVDSAGLGTGAKFTVVLPLS